MKASLEGLTLPSSSCRVISVRLTLLITIPVSFTGVSCLGVVISYYIRCRVVGNLPMSCLSVAMPSHAGPSCSSPSRSSKLYSAVPSGWQATSKSIPPICHSTATPPPQVVLTLLGNMVLFSKTAASRLNISTAALGLGGVLPSGRFPPCQGNLDISLVTTSSHPISWPVFSLSEACGIASEFLRLISFSAMLHRISRMMARSDLASSWIVVVMANPRVKLDLSAQLGQILVGFRGQPFCTSVKPFNILFWTNEAGIWDCLLFKQSPCSEAKFGDVLAG